VQVANAENVFDHFPIHGMRLRNRNVHYWRRLKQAKWITKGLQMIKARFGRLFKTLENVSQFDLIAGRKNDQLAFWSMLTIAWTVDLILRKWPELKINQKKKKKKKREKKKKKNPF